MEDKEKDVKFIRLLDPEPSVRMHPKFVYSGFNVIGLFEREDGEQLTKVLTFTPKKMHYKNTSKYMPHQGEQEKARRVRNAI